MPDTADRTTSSQATGEMAGVENPKIVTEVRALVGDLRQHVGGQKALDQAQAALTKSLGSGGVAVRREIASATMLQDAEPTLTAGRAVVTSLGPFLDRLGRDVFIDLFERRQMVAFVRAGESRPFLLVEVRGLPLTSASIPLEAGSVWFRSDQLASAAPSGGYTGLKITGGSLAFGSSLTLSGTSVVIPPNVNVTLTMQLAVSAPVIGAGPGQDARDMVIQTPTHATFIFGPAGASLSGLGTAQLIVYGTKIPMAPFAGGPVYRGDVAQIAVPYRTEALALSIFRTHSSLITPAGKASIISVAWSLPVAVANPATLGDATGAGGILLGLGDGLRTSWPEHPAPVDLGPCSLLAEYGVFSLFAPTAHIFGGIQRITLWDDSGTRGNVDLENYATSPWRYIAFGNGRELLAYQAQASALFDRPLNSHGDRVPVNCSHALVLFVQDASGIRLLLEGAVDPPASPTANYVFALANAVLKTGPAASFALFGPYQANLVRSGLGVLDFRLNYLLPILPDPYVSNLDYSTLKESRSRNLGLLSIVLVWAPNAPLKMVIILPPTADALLRPMPVPTASSSANVGLVLSSAEGFPAASKALVEDQHNVSELAAMFSRSGGPELLLLDVSTNVSQFGVGFTVSAGSADKLVSTGAPVLTGRFVVADMFLQSAGRNVRVITLPEVQWEPVATRDGPTFPTPVTFADCGGPTQLATETVELVAVAPRLALDFMVAGYQRKVSPLPLNVRFTLPFGIEAVATLKRTGNADLDPTVTYITPQFPVRNLAGCDQVSLQAGPDTPGPGGVSLSGLPGAAIQLRNALHLGFPTGESVLTPIDVTFNSNFGPGSPLGRVPVKRIDLSGYGESLFSEWKNPVDAAAVISKAEFDVLTGRTSLEIVQAYSVLYPYAVRVVRTITIQRENGGTVVRHDSGWQAVTEGVYVYPTPGLRTHPGVVRGVRDVINISDTGQTFNTSDGSLLMAVRFDCNVDIEGVVKGGTPRGVPSRQQLGFVQLTDPPHRGLLGEVQYQELIAAFPTMGGAVNCEIRVGAVGPQMRVTNVGVGTAAGIGVPEFAMAAYGSPVFPAGGQWSFICQNTADESSRPVNPQFGVPLIREGLAPSPPPPSSAYRFADPQDLLLPTNPATDYGILHASGTQRLLLPRPKVETGANAITSTRAILLADPFALATAAGPFPHASVCVPIPDPAWKLQVVAPDHFVLGLSQPEYDMSIERTIIDAPPIHTVVRYHDENGTPSKVRVVIDTAAPVPWSFSATNVLFTSHSDSFGEMMTVVTDINAAAGSQTGFNNVRTIFGGPLGPVLDAFSFLSNFGSGSPPYDVGMTNDFKLNAGLKIPAVKGFTDAMKAAVPVLEDLDIKVLETVWASPLSSEATFEIEVTIAIPVSVFVLVIMAKFQVKLIAGGSPGAFNGVAVLFQLGLGCGLKGKIGPFEAIGYVMVTAIFVFGDVSGIGWSALAKFSIDLKIIEIEVSVEGGTAHLNSSCGSGAGLQKTGFNVQQATVAVEVTIAWVIDIEFEYQSTSHSVTEVSNTALPPCDFPDVL
jgi:hypothetical protein